MISRFIYSIKELLEKLPLSVFFNILKILWKPRRGSWLYRVIRFWDPFIVLLPGNRKFKLYFKGKIERTIFWNGLEGAKEKKSIEIWQRLCPEAEVIFDVGANTGIYSLIAAASNSHSSIHAFEPNKSISLLLKNNISINYFSDRIKVIEKAVSNTSNLLKIDDYKNHGQFISSKSISIDEYIAINHINRFDIIKIDVEGFEPKVIEGAMNSIERYRPSILIEILSDEVGSFIHQKLKSFNYLYYDIDDYHNKVNKVEFLRKSSFYNYFICTEETAKTIGLTLI